jgi:hypothetical protein
MALRCPRPSLHQRTSTAFAAFFVFVMQSPRPLQAVLGVVHSIPRPLHDLLVESYLADYVGVSARGSLVELGWPIVSVRLGVDAERRIHLTWRQICDLAIRTTSDAPAGGSGRSLAEQSFVDGVQHYVASLRTDACPADPAVSPVAPSRGSHLCPDVLGVPQDHYRHVTRSTQPP